MHDLKDIQTFIKDSDVKFVDLRFTNIKGKEQHVTIPSKEVNEDLLRFGKMFDGSSIEGWKGINESDMVLMPDFTDTKIDPFCKFKTLIVHCNILEPIDMKPYTRDPRSIAKKCEEYIKSTGIADEIMMGPEPEFFIFDAIDFKSNMQGCEYSIHSNESIWNSNKTGHRPDVKGGYFPVPPVDSLHDIRCEICDLLQEVGQTIETHHHEVASAGQCEIGTKFSTLINKADQVQVFKYIVHNVANRNGKTATFMPKPIPDDNGSGMHIHQSLSKNGINIFSGNEYSGLSKNAIYYIGGIIKHAKALNAFCNPSTNSYKRLVPGFEAPILLAYSACNRSAAIRIPFVNSKQGKRIELRFPDPTSNPYLAFSAIAMAGVDGIINKINPGKPIEEDLYNLPSKELSKIPSIALSLMESLDYLDKNRGFLKKGKVFTDDFIDAYIDLKYRDVKKINMTPHPIEFDMYYSL